MKQKKLFVSSNSTIIKTRFQKISNSRYFAIFLKCIIYSEFGFILYNFLHAKFVWMLSFVKFQLQNCVFLYLLSFLLHRIGNFSAYLAALFVASVSKLSRARSADARVETLNLGILASFPPQQSFFFKTVLPISISLYFRATFFRFSF